MTALSENGVCTSRLFSLFIVRLRGGKEVLARTRRVVLLPALGCMPHAVPTGDVLLCAVGGLVQACRGIYE